MVRVGRPNRVLSVLTTTAALAFVLVQSGCRTTEDDVHRWASTVNGPRKLVAVLTHDKYSVNLRIEAASTLITMKPRSGQHVGLLGGDEADQPGLLEAMTRLPTAARAQLIAGLLPRLHKGMALPVEGGEDPSIPYKDAAFGLLTHEGGALISSVKVRDELKASLEKWVLAAFETRLENSSQSYGMEQVLHHLGDQAVRGLPPRITVDAPKLARIASFVADLGDESTKKSAGESLVKVARFVGSKAWLKQKAPAVRKANEESNLNPEERLFRAQLQQYQEEELLRLFGSMKKLGTSPVITFLIEVAGGKELPEKRRAAALAALQGHLDEQSESQVQSMLALARNEDTPDAVRGLALERVGEMPRGLVIKDLFGLFHSQKWQVRWVAAELVLKMSNASQLDEFMRELATIEDMAITEPIRYGALLGKLKPPPSHAELAEKYASAEYATPVRLAALGYFREHGTKADLSRLQLHANDGNKVPDCRKDADGCEWLCVTGQGKSQRQEEIETLGQFVTFCVLPAIESRDGKRSKPDSNSKTQLPKQESP